MFYDFRLFHAQRIISAHDILTFLSLRFAFGILCLIPIVIIYRPRWPGSQSEFGHVVAAGLLMHAVHLGGSHYTQYLVLLELLLFGVVPTAMSVVGIVVTCFGVALVAWKASRSVR